MMQDPSTEISLDTQLQRFLNEETPGLEIIRQELTVFSPFSVFHPNEEGSGHLALWAWVLNPKGSHACGPAFLERFAQFIRHLPSDILSSVLLSNHSHTEVHQAWNFKDLVVTNRPAGWALVIEHKAEKESSLEEQLTAHQMRSQRDFEDGMYVHYVVVSQRLFEARRFPGLDGYDTMLFQDALLVLEQTLAHAQPKPSVKEFIQSYIRFFNTHFMTNSRDLVHTAQAIYWKHREAIEFILKNRPVLNTSEHFQDVFRFFKDEDMYATLTPQKDEIFRFLPVSVQEKFRYGGYSWHHMFEIFCVELCFEETTITAKFVFGGIWHKDPERREQLQEVKDRLFENMRQFDTLRDFLVERSHARGRYPSVAQVELMHLRDLEEFNGNFAEAFRVRFEYFEREVLGPWTEEVLERIPDRDRHLFP
jgi:hypothetical protein